MSLLEVVSVSRDYPGVRALDAVSLGLDRSEVVGLVGHNGAGKSTLTRILGGVERPDGGELRIDGQEVSFSGPDDAIAAGICVVPQQLSVVPQLSVADNILLGIGRGRKEMRKQVRGVAETLGIADALRSEVRVNSQSMQRLVMIARAMLRRPKILLLDEPTAALHPLEAERLFAVIGQLRRQGVAVVFISHRLDEILSQTSRVVIMRQGKVVAIEAAEDLDKRRLAQLMVGRHPNPRQVERREAPGEAVLSCKGVTSGKLEDVSVEARAGRILGVAGLDGSGRAEFLRVLAGVQSLEGGEITVQGRPIGKSRRSAIRAGVAYLPGDRVHTGVIPEMNVAAAVTLGDDRASRVHPSIPLLRPARERAKIEATLLDLDIHPRGATRLKMKQLSGGNQQKALMARSLLAGAKAYLFDEPTEGVDIGARADLHAEIRRLAADGAAVVVASSESDELVELADQIIVFYNGRVCAELAAENISESAVTEACLVG